jgi:hypothetical protein
MKEFAFLLFRKVSISVIVYPSQAIRIRLIDVLNLLMGNCLTGIGSKLKNVGPKNLKVLCVFSSLIPGKTMLLLFLVL